MREARSGESWGTRSGWVLRAALAAVFSEDVVRDDAVRSTYFLYASRICVVEAFSDISRTASVKKTLLLDFFTCIGHYRLTVIGRC